MPKNPHRHCTCTNHLVELISRELQKQGFPLETLKAWHKLAENVIPGCNGTEIPNVQWDAIAAKVGQMLEQDAAKHLADLAIEADERLEGTAINEILAASMFYNVIAKRAVTGMKNLWDILLSGGSPKPGRILH